MNDLQVRYFLGIVSNGMNFTKASQALYVSQPALSKHINNLGAELGVKLFDTTKKNAMRLTPGGELLYRFFSEYRGKLQETILSAKALNNQEVYELKIACLHGWDVSVLLKKINAFSQEHQNIVISINSIEFRPMKMGLLDNRYDIAISTSHEFEDIQNVSVKELFPVHHILLYSSSHCLAAKKDPTILDFKDDILYILDTDYAPHAKPINESYCKAKGFIPRIKIIPNIDSLLLAIESGTGYAILDTQQRIMVNPNFKHFELDIDQSVCAVWKKDNPNTALEIFCSECLNSWQ
jgi:DNA-binding transcriptional LysR family regulator